MEWVETRGRTVADAMERALDELGVAADDAEFEVVDEGSSALFGLRRTEARVRARVRPQPPRPKAERRDRGRKRTRGSNGGSGGGDKKPSGGGRPDDNRSGQRGGPDARSRGRGKAPSTPSEAVPTAVQAPTQDDPKEHAVQDTNEAFAETDQQATVATFLDGLLEAFDLEGTVSTKMDDGLVKADIQGEELGLLIGPRGGTLRAIQELSWTVLQREAAGRESGSVRIDVGGYAERRREALRQFAVTQAEEAKASGSTRVLEPMNAADRKVVHDALVEVDGVETVSEGEDPRRRVVIVVRGDD